MRTMTAIEFVFHHPAARALTERHALSLHATEAELAALAADLDALAAAEGITVLEDTVLEVLGAALEIERASTEPVLTTGADLVRALEAEMEALVAEGRVCRILGEDGGVQYEIVAVH